MFYTRLFLPFSPCGTMFPQNSLSLQDTWQKETRQMRSRRRRCVDRVDLSPPDHYHDTCTKKGISEIRRPQLNPIETHRGDTWTHRDGPIFIGRAKHVEGVGRDLRSWETRGRMMSLRSSSDGSRQRKIWTTLWATIPTVCMIGRRKSRREMDDSYLSREFFFKN